MDTMWKGFQMALSLFGGCVDPPAKHDVKRNDFESAQRA